ncbi:MAG: cytochrome bc complex cytochrome b subunit [Candidatus Binatia bacterium]
MPSTLRRLWRRLTWTWAPASEREAGEAIVQNLWLHWFPAKITARAMSWSYSLWLGTATASLFVILTVTGILLMFFYIPSPQVAYWSTKDITYAVSFGWLLRNQHRWAAHLMVAVTFFHMARVFFTGAYRGARSLNWLVGLALLLVTLLMSFTGYLLPWDQLAFWAVTVGTNIAKEAPVVGKAIRFILLGGTEIGASALIRFYVLHAVVLPVVTVALFAYHMWRVRRDGGLASMEGLRAARAPHTRSPVSTRTYSIFGATRGATVQVLSSTVLEEEDTVFSAPELARRVTLVFLLVFNITLLLSLFFNAPLEEAANAAVTPNPAKAPWYFLWLQELVSTTTIRIGTFTVSGGFIGGILVPGVLFVLAAVWPFLDRSPLAVQGQWFPRARRRQNVIFALIAVGIVALIIVGVFLRGPYWHLYWPGAARPTLPTVM